MYRRCLDCENITINENNEFICPLKSNLNIDGDIVYEKLNNIDIYSSTNCKDYIEKSNKENKEVPKQTEVTEENFKEKFFKPENNLNVLNPTKDKSVNKDKNITENLNIKCEPQKQLNDLKSKKIISFILGLIFNIIGVAFSVGLYNKYKGVIKYSIFGLITNLFLFLLTIFIMFAMLISSSFSYDIDYEKQYSFENDYVEINYPDFNDILEFTDFQDALTSDELRSIELFPVSNKEYYEAQRRIVYDNEIDYEYIENEDAQYIVTPYKNGVSYIFGIDKYGYPCNILLKKNEIYKYVYDTDEFEIEKYKV